MAKKKVTEETIPTVTTLNENENVEKIELEDVVLNVKETEESIENVETKINLENNESLNNIVSEIKEELNVVTEIKEKVAELEDLCTAINSYVEVEIIDGKQDIYSYIIAVE